MKQVTSLTLGILMSLYPRADFNTVGDSFATTNTDEQALKLVEDSAVTADHMLDMILLDMS
jgi:hypothetical protein